MTILEQESRENHPGYRQKHIAIINDNFMYIYGGLINALESTNEMHAYNFTENKWELV
jgi:hypothetical protein